MKVIRGGVAKQSPSIGLVLGAGGVVGQAYQAGVLAALEREIGWDPRLATIIVGTSAGLRHGAALRVGVPATDLAASLYGVPTSRRGGAILRRILPADTEPLPTPSVLSMLRPWNLPSPALLARTARRPLAFRPDVAAMTLVPRGQLDITERARGLDDLIGDRWPEGLRICAVRRSDGGRVVFGRPGAPPARLAPAVLASCAIPGYFRPVADRGHRLHRRRRPLGHQRRRAARRGPRPGRHHLVDVGRARQRQRRRRLAAPHGAPPHGARGRPARSGPAPPSSASSRAASPAASWACGRWPRTARPGSSRRRTRRRAGGCSRRRSWPRWASHRRRAATPAAG